MGKERISFLIAGAQKSSTTALFHYRRRHSSLFLPPCKEVHFFDNDENYKKMSQTILNITDTSHL